MKYLGLMSIMILLHHIQRVEVWNGLEGVKSHQGAASMGVKHLHAVPGLQAFQHCQGKNKYYQTLSGKICIVTNVYRCTHTMF